GCYGYYGYYSHGVVVAPVAVAAPAVVAPASPAPVIIPPRPMQRAIDTRRDEGPAPARVTIVIPEGARLFVNDMPVEVNPAARTFETPRLDPGKPYHYVFKAEVMNDGRMVRDVQRVDVAAGKQ